MVPRDDAPLTPQATVEWYLDTRRDELRMATLRKQESALGSFLEWTAAAGIETMNDVGGREVMRFKAWRKAETELSPVSLNGVLAILRRFLRFCERIDAVEADLADRVPLPNVPEDEEISEVVPSDDAVQSMRAYYATFEYASRRQTQLELIAETGIRLGAVRAIDLGDLDLDGKVVQLQHRPEGPDSYGTPLKNGRDGERVLNMSLDLCDTIEDYVSHHRVDVVDEFGREPLFTTSEGRVTTATTRRDFYKLTRPCMYGEGCPHDREISSCEATQNARATECPSRFSTHPLRRWSIMRQLDEGVPKELLSDRVDVSVPVLEKHYDQRSEERKSRRRREELQHQLPEFAPE